MKQRNQRNNYGELLEAITDYLGAYCSYCGDVDGLIVHHVLPVDRGGKNRIANFEIVCKKCHQKIHKVWNEIMPIKKVEVRICIKCGRKETVRQLGYCKELCTLCRKSNNKKIYD